MYCDCLAIVWGCMRASVYRFQDKASLETQKFDFASDFTLERMFYASSTLLFLIKIWRERVASKIYRMHYTCLRIYSCEVDIFSYLLFFPDLTAMKTGENSIG